MTAVRADGDASPLGGKGGDGGNPGTAGEWWCRRRGWGRSGSSRDGVPSFRGRGRRGRPVTATAVVPGSVRDRGGKAAQVRPAVPVVTVVRSVTATAAVPVVASSSDGGTGGAGGVGSQGGAVSGNSSNGGAGGTGSAAVTSGVIGGKGRQGAGGAAGLASNSGNGGAGGASGGERSGGRSCAGWCQHVRGRPVWAAMVVSVVSVARWQYAAAATAGPAPGGNSSQRWRQGDRDRR